MDSHHPSNVEVLELENRWTERMEVFEMRLEQCEVIKAVADLTKQFLKFKSEVLDTLDMLKANNEETKTVKQDISPSLVSSSPDVGSVNKMLNSPKSPSSSAPSKKIEKILQDIMSKKLKVDEDEKSAYVAAFEELYSIFRQELNKTDPLFETYLKKLNTGSHSIKTRVGTPNEFDVNLCIKLPSLLYPNLEIKNCTRDGYIQIKTSLENWNTLKKNQIWEKCKSVEKWIDPEGYLLESQIRSWMESKVQSVFNNLGERKILTAQNTGNQYKIRSKKSGPAFTLLVEKVGTGIQFDVDLVPSIVFTYPPHWPCTIKEKYTKEYKDNEWFAVAKPLSTEKDGKRFWRPSLALQEIEMLSGSYHLKNALRLIKKLRDTNQLSYIPTYHINTLFMWKKFEENASYWEKPLSQIFIEMLKKLEKALADEKIPCFWNKQHNLLDSLSPNQKKDGSARLKVIIKNIEKNLDNAEEIQKIICGS